jgi:hypothetical protein
LRFSSCALRWGFGSEFVAQGEHSAWDQYFVTLYHFKATVAQAYQAYEYTEGAKAGFLQGKRWFRFAAVE